MLGFVASWAQWAIDVSTAPVYVEVNGHSGSANVRTFTITTPENAPAYTVEVKEKPLAGATAGTIAKVSTANSGNAYTATFSPAVTGSSVGITRYYVQIKVGDEVVSSTEAEPFEVNVYDETKARFITNPGDQYITKSDTKFVVEFAPATAAAGATITATQGTGNKGTITVGSTFTVENQQKNLVSFTLSCNAQVEVGDKVTITIAPPSGSKDRNGKDVPSVTFTLTVNLPELPVQGVTTEFHQFKVGYEFSSPLKLEGFEEGEDKDYTVKYTYIPVAGYRNDVVSITPNDKQTALLRTEHAGMAYVKATFTPHGTKAQSYRAWERILTVVASPTQMKLAPLTYETTGTGTGATYDFNFDKAADDPEVTYDPALAAGVTPEYEITYSLEGALPSTAHMEDKTGYLKSVVIDDGDPSQVFYLVATLTPTGANASDYLSDVVRVPILVHGSGNTGAFLEKQSDGSWVAYLDQPSSTDKNIVAVFTVKNGTLDEFKAATNIKVMGSINSFNIAQLVHAMGADGTSSYSGALKTVDMSGCVMNGPLEFSHTKANESDPVETFKFPITGVAVGDDNTRVGKSLTLKNVANFTFPKPDPNYTTLPSDVSAFFGNQYNPADNNLTSLTIPEGWTEVPDGFSGKTSDNRYRTSAFSKLVNLKLANTIEKIGPYAFADLKAVVLTMPYNIDRIGKSAFSTSLKLQDVYFTGPAPRYVDTQAFSGETQMCNNTVKDSGLQGKVDPETDRSNYYDQEGANKVLACLLHFPEQYRAQYTDVTRVYKRLSMEEVDAHNANFGTNWDYKYSKGYKTFVPDGWTPTFLAAVRAGVIDPNAYVSNTVDYGAKDAFYGLDMIWPSQSQMSTGYAIAQAGYKWSGQPLDADQYQKGAKYEDTNNSIDRRGLYQFIIALANADIDVKFESGLWYTIALPFDMSPTEIKKVFGEDTQVCRFSKVTRITEGENKQIKLEFRNSVMGDMEQNSTYDGTNYAADALSEAGYRLGIRHHYPYMIKPSGTTDEQYTTHENVGGKSIWHFNGLDFPRESGVLVADMRRDTEHDGSADAQYMFSPILSTAKIKTYSYILAEDKTSKKHKYFFYKGVKKLDEAGNPVIANNDSFVDDGDYVYEPGGSANQNTAYVMCNITGETVDGTHVTWKDWGYEDYKIFFKDIDPNKPTSSPSAGAKVFSFFGDEEDDAPTAVEKVVIVCGQDGIEDDKVYTINGVRVNADYLPAGLYIKNGKKFIVK